MNQDNIKQFGQVIVERSTATGRWIWIEGFDGYCHCEVDCGLDLTAVPTLLHSDVQQAYEWAKAENEKVDDGNTQSRQELHDEWLHHYNLSR